MNRNSDEISLGPVGASERSVTLRFSDSGVEVEAGCFNGGTSQMRAAIEEAYQKHYQGDRSNGTTVQYDSAGDMKMLAKYKAEYLALCDFAEALQRIWTRKRVRNAGPKKNARRGRGK
jgi:hypothetical protein